MVIAELSMSLIRTVSEKSMLTRSLLRSSRKPMISGALVSAWYEVAWSALALAIATTALPDESDAPPAVTERYEEAVPRAKPSRAVMALKSDRLGVIITSVSLIMDVGDPPVKVYDVVVGGTLFCRV